MERAKKRLDHEYKSFPLDHIKVNFKKETVLEWHFLFIGQNSTPFEGGEYHGTLFFPENYPFSPPSIRFITPNGRFQTNERVCFSISDFHPENWKPAYTMSAFLQGVYDFMMSETTDTVGSLVMDEEEIRELAKKSREFNKSDDSYIEMFEDRNDGAIKCPLVTSTSFDPLMNMSLDKSQSDHSCTRNKVVARRLGIFPSVPVHKSVLDSRVDNQWDFASGPLTKVSLERSRSETSYTTDKMVTCRPKGYTVNSQTVKLQISESHVPNFSTAHRTSPMKHIVPCSPSPNSLIASRDNRPDRNTADYLLTPSDTNQTSTKQINSTNCPYHLAIKELWRKASDTRSINNSSFHHSKYSATDELPKDTISDFLTQKPLHHSSKTSTKRRLLDNTSCNSFMGKRVANHSGRFENGSVSNSDRVPNYLDGNKGRILTVPSDYLEESSLQMYHPHHSKTIDKCVAHPPMKSENSLVCNFDQVPHSSYGKKNDSTSDFPKQLESNVVVDSVSDLNSGQFLPLTTISNARPGKDYNLGREMDPFHSNLLHSDNLRKVFHSTPFKVPPKVHYEDPFAIKTNQTSSGYIPRDTVINTELHNFDISDYSIYNNSTPNLSVRKSFQNLPPYPPNSSIRGNSLEDLNGRKANDRPPSHPLYFSIRNRSPVSSSDITKTKQRTPSYLYNSPNSSRININVKRTNEGTPSRLPNSSSTKNHLLYKC